MRWQIVLAATLMAATGCTKRTSAEATPEPETRPESSTNWTTKSELFVEYPPLIAGQTSRFAIHLTRLDNFRPVSRARVEVRLHHRTGDPEVFAATSPARPGIFGVNVTPAGTGEVHLSIHIRGEIDDIHDLGTIQSSPAKAAVIQGHGTETEEKIAFLKEQQWTLEFATEVIKERQLRTTLRVPAEVIPRTGGQAEVTVPFDGRLVSTNIPPIGTRVRQGHVVASLLPPVASAPGDLAGLELSKREAELELQLARKDLARAERLSAAGAAPFKRLEEARTVEATAEARVTAAEIRLAQYNSASAGENSTPGAKLFTLRAPITGVITQVDAAPRSNVKAGEVLLRITDLETVYVSAVVPEAQLPEIQRLTGAEMEVPGADRLVQLRRLVSIGRVIDPQSRTFPVIYEFDNRSRTVAINQAVYVRLLTSAQAVGPAVPESSIVDDGGRPAVFIQQAGETFLRRPVKLGAREGGYVQALEGVSPGQRVVSRGAFLIRLSAMSTEAPAHGHVH